MAGFKGSQFTDRAQASAEAKKAALEKFRASAPKPDDPAVLARAAERRAIAEARDIRMAERRKVKEAEAERMAEESRLRAIEEARLAAEEEERKAGQARREEEIKAERKAARDAKDAARTARRGRARLLPGGAAPAVFLIDFQAGATVPAFCRRCEGGAARRPDAE